MSDYTPDNPKENKGGIGNIITGLEGNRIIRWKPVFGQLPENQTYFLMVRFDDDRGLRSISMTYSKLS